MKDFAGKTLSWELRDGIVELTLDHEPANEIGTGTLADLEKFATAIPALAPETAACIISSARKQGFSAGADLRELYRGTDLLSEKERLAGVREVDVLGDILAAPSHAEHVAVGKECMRADQEPASLEEPVLREAPKDSTVLARDRGATEAGGGSG